MHLTMSFTGQFFAYLCRMAQNNDTFQTIKSVIETRRTLKPESMNGKQIPKKIFEQLVALADWAPTHGRTEPWRFFIYTGQAFKDFCRVHADMYRQYSPTESYKPETYENLLHKGDLASHLVVASMKRGTNEKIPLIEEICSAAASVENVLLGAAAIGISAMWNTGGMVHKTPMKEHFQLAEEDHIIGFIYFGYTDEPAKEGKRVVPLAEKVIYK